MPVHKILLVDDSKTELHYLSDLLLKRGYSVRTAEGGDEALKRLAEDKPDLILMDVVMPGLNGFQLTRTITRDPRYADLPVIMCTSKNQETPAFSVRTCCMRRTNRVCRSRRACLLAMCAGAALQSNCLILAISSSACTGLTT